MNLTNDIIIGILTHIGTGRPKVRSEIQDFLCKIDDKDFQETKVIKSRAKDGTFTGKRKAKVHRGDYTKILNRLELDGYLYCTPFGATTWYSLTESSRQLLETNKKMDRLKAELKDVVFRY